MIRLPLERLLERIAAEVGDAVPRDAEDQYARAQLEAAAEILRNLAPRVVWREDDAARDPLAPRPVLSDSCHVEDLRSLAARQLDDELSRLRR